MKETRKKVTEEVINVELVTLAGEKTELQINDILQFKEGEFSILRGENALILLWNGIEFFSIDLYWKTAEEIRRKAMEIAFKEGKGVSQISSDPFRFKVIPKPGQKGSGISLEQLLEKELESEPSSS